MIKIRYSGNFLRDFQELITNSPEIKELVREKTKLFKNKPVDTRLNSHPLKRRMKGKWAFSVTQDIRVVYKRLGKNMVRFLAIGSHRKVYKKRVS